MCNVKNSGKGKYIISVDTNSIQKAYSSYLKGKISPIGHPSTHNFTATITVEINDDFAASVRGLCSTKLNVKADLGSPANELSILRGLMRAPLPVAPAHGNGHIPEMSKEQLDNIETNLESVKRKRSVTFTANISNGAKMALVFLPDTMGFRVELVDMSQGMKLYREHPYVLTSFFTIDKLPEKDLGRGPGEAFVSAEIDDARVFVESEQVDVNFDETLTTELSRIKYSDTNNVLLNAYYQLLNEMFWRKKQIVAKRILQRPYVSHLYGVGLSGKAITVIDLQGLTPKKYRTQASLNFKGTANVNYIYGDIIYPANPMLSETTVKFDIISDSKDWTLHGPTSIQYVDENGSDETPETIFSWQGRTSVSPKIFLQVNAGLKDYKKDSDE